MSASTYDFLVFICVLAAVALIAYIVYRIYQKKRLSTYLDSMWGVAPDRSYSKNEFESIKENALFLNNASAFILDDATWNDLDMDAVYRLINHTHTNAGDHVLYRALRNPSEEAHKNTSRLIKWAESKADERQNIRGILYKCGRMGNVSLKLLLEDNPYKKKQQVAAAFLCGGLIASIVLSSLGITAALIPLFAFVVVNGIYSARMHRKFSNFVDTVSYITAISKCFCSLAESYDGEAVFDSQKTASIINATSSVRKSSALSLFYLEDAIAFMLNQLFVLESMSFIHMFRKVKEHASGLLDAYRYVGMADAAFAAASYRSSLGYYCEPLFHKTGRPQIKMSDAVHPLLKAPVANSAEIGRSTLITGSNATGKSTFLKMTAINAILAQTINTCLAKSWESPFFRIFTSMALRDNIFENESYFITEIKSIKRMLYSHPTDCPALCILDEVLRGTNTGERIAASSEILRELASGTSLCLAATHDLELSFILENIYANAHFTESISDGEMTFDFKLKQGRSNTTNAIKLLAILGYDGALVENAERRFKTFSETGSWEKL